jgi:uncharacterized coiled-coil DUF342 family protein
MSDDEDDEAAIVVGSVDGRILQLERENAAILRDLTTVQSERDMLKARKDTYKSKLLEREEVIVELGKRVKDLEKSYRWKLLG